MKSAALRTVLFGLMLLAAVLLSGAVSDVEPAVFTVTSDGDVDDGLCDPAGCTLREAINAANANPGRDTIHFNIPGAGPHLIRPNTALPAVTDPVTIDGYSQTDAHPNANPRGQGLSTLLRIEVDGSSAGAANGITFAGLSSGSTLRGLAINRFAGAGILLSGNGSLTITGNFIGTDITGSFARGNRYGISGENSFQNLVGGATPDAANLISGNTEAGIALYNHFAFSTIQGNFIGTDLAGSRALGNGTGVVVAAWNNIIRGNLISGNVLHGIDITGSHSTSTLIQENWIGTDATGAGLLGNGGSGIFSRGSANKIERNVIWGNQGNGVTGAADLAATPLRANSIAANAGLGIDAGDNGVTPNVPGAMANYPLLTATDTGTGATILEASLNGASNTPYVIEFFASRACDPSGYGEGEFPLTPPITVTTDAAGNVTTTYTTTLPAERPFVTAVSIGPSFTTPPVAGEGASSEFAACISGVTAAEVMVNTTADPGDGICDSAECTLREAVTASNLAPGGTIRFALTTPNTITLTAGEIVIARSLTIAGPGAAQLAISGDGKSRVFLVTGSRKTNVHIDDVTIARGDAYQGGGIYNMADLTLAGTILQENVAEFDRGGALFNTGDVTASDCRFFANYAWDGGAVYNVVGAHFRVVVGEFSNNESRFRGGALYNIGGAILERVLVSNNHDGIHNEGSLMLLASTVSGNRVSREPGSIVNTGALLLDHSTVADNAGSGIMTNHDVNLRHVVLANDVNCAMASPPAPAHFVSLAPNLASDATCNLTGVGDLSNVDPLLGPLQDNGGPTWTHALLPGSPAIDAGANASCLTPDQRGVLRPQPVGGICDLGAFETLQHPLTIAVAGDGSGAVTPEAGVHYYAAGSAITVSATAAPGSGFTGWDGACAGQGNPCAVTMDGDKTVTATFVRNHHRLSIAVAGGGSGTVMPLAGIHDFFEGDTVVISATAAPGSSFTGWGGACEGQVNPCSLTMDNDYEVTATFAWNAYPLTVAKSGAGSGRVVSTPAGIDCGGSCGAMYAHDSVVSLTATADAGAQFDGWHGACSGDAGCTVTVDAPKAVTATFSASSAPAIVADGEVIVGRTVHFTATLGLSSYDRCGWDFGDGSTAPCQAGATAAGAEMVNSITVQAAHTYAAEGSYTVRVVVVNAAGTVQAEMEVAIGGAAAVELYMPILRR